MHVAALSPQHSVMLSNVKLAIQILNSSNTNLPFDHTMEVCW